MNEDCLKLTTYFGERDRTDDGFLADTVTDIYARHQLQTSLVMRGAAGFGPRRHLRTDRRLTLSEDLPVVSVAVDTRRHIEAALDELTELHFDGLVTLERARLHTGPVTTVPELPWRDEAETKLTVYLGRQERVNGMPAYEALVAFLHARGIAGATVLLGVDGTTHGVRHRARFFARNGSVPLMVVGVGDSARVADLVPELGSMLGRPLLTLQRIRVCKRDGMQLAEPPRLPETDSSGLGVWQKLMVYSGAQARVQREPLHHALMRELLHAKAAGATSLRGVWGYDGGHPPHGDSFWQLRRRVPILTVIVDTPERIQRWFALVDAVTEQTGLVTSEMVPAYRATAGHTRSGGLRLADRLPAGDD